MGSELCMNGLPYRGISPSGVYLSSVGLLDTIADTTGSYPIGGAFPGIGGGYGCDPMSMGGSIMTGGGACASGMGGYYGYGPGVETTRMTLEEYADYQQKLRVKGVHQQVDMKHQLEGAEFSSKAQNSVIVDKAIVLHGLIKENNQDQVSEAYESLLESVRGNIKEVYGIEPNEGQVRAYAKELYLKSNPDARSISGDLHEYGDSPFFSGFKKAAGGIGWAFMENKSSDENIAEINGTKIPKSERAKEIIGGVVSGILTVAALIIGGKLCKKGYNKLFAADKAAIGALSGGAGI